MADPRNGGPKPNVRVRVCVCVNTDIINRSSSCCRRVRARCSSVAQRRGTGNIMCPTFMVNDIELSTKARCFFQLELFYVCILCFGVVRDKVGQNLL